MVLLLLKAILIVMMIMTMITVEIAIVMTMTLSLPLPLNHNYCHFHTRKNRININNYIPPRCENQAAVNEPLTHFEDFYATLCNAHSTSCTTTLIRHSIKIRAYKCSVRYVKEYSISFTRVRDGSHQLNSNRVRK